MPRSDGVRNFVHVDDAAALMLAAAESQAAGVLDIGHPEALTYEKIAELAYSLFGKGGTVSIAPEKTPFRHVSFPEGGEAFKLLGRKPEIAMAEGIARIRDAGTWQNFGPMDVK